MALLSKSVATVNLGTTNTTPANRLLAASATVGRWLRGVTVRNNSGGTLTWNFAWGTGAILTAANSAWFGASISPTSTAIANGFVYQWPGRGVRLATTDEVMGFASGANVSMEFTYDELDLT